MNGQYLPTSALHVHRAIPRMQTAGAFFSPVTVGHQNPRAHGGTCEVDECRCGAKRRTNRNGRQVERGEWL